jgi:hypothetical protein
MPKTTREAEKAGRKAKQAADIEKDLEGQGVSKGTARKRAGSMVRALHSGMNRSGSSAPKRARKQPDHTPEKEANAGTSRSRRPGGRQSTGGKPTNRTTRASAAKPAKGRASTRARTSAAKTPGAPKKTSSRPRSGRKT